MNGGGVRADTTLLGRLRELDEKASPAPWGVTVGSGAFVPWYPVKCELDGELIGAARNALPSVVALVEAAQGVEAVIRKCAVENIEVDADALGAWSILLRGPLAPFQKGTE